MTTTAAKRVQQRRTKGWRLPPGAVIVSRPSRWGNPFKVGSDGVGFSGPMLGEGAGYYNAADPRFCDVSLGALTAAQAVTLYRDDLTASIEEGGADYDELRQALAALRGHDLACWCPLDQPCHADVLLEIANGPSLPRAKKRASQ